MGQKSAPKFYRSFLRLLKKRFLGAVSSRCPSYCNIMEKFVRMISVSFNVRIDWSPKSGRIRKFYCTKYEKWNVKLKNLKILSWHQNEKNYSFYLKWKIGIEQSLNDSTECLRKRIHDPKRMMLIRHYL